MGDPLEFVVDGRVWEFADTEYLVFRLAGRVEGASRMYHCIGGECVYGVRIALNRDLTDKTLKKLDKKLKKASRRIGHTPCMEHRPEYNWVEISVKGYSPDKDSKVLSEVNRIAEFLYKKLEK